MVRSPFHFFPLSHFSLIFLSFLFFFFLFAICSPSQWSKIYSSIIRVTQVNDTRRRASFVAEKVKHSHLRLVPEAVTRFLPKACSFLSFVFINTTFVCVLDSTTSDASRWNNIHKSSEDIFHFCHPSNLSAYACALPITFRSHTHTHSRTRLTHTIIQCFVVTLSRFSFRVFFILPLF